MKLAIVAVGLDGVFRVDITLDVGVSTSLSMSASSSLLPLLSLSLLSPKRISPLESSSGREDHSRRAAVAAGGICKVFGRCGRNHVVAHARFARDSAPLGYATNKKHFQMVQRFRSA